MPSHGRHRVHFLACTLNSNIEQIVSAPEIAPANESAESRPSKRGGKRPGAGRKPNLAKRLLKGFSQAVANVDCGAVIAGLLKTKREKTRLETVIFLRDTFWGRPAQDVRHSGGMVHAHMGWGSLSHLTDEEIAVLENLYKNPAAPVSNASPDAHQHQIESKPAFEAEVVKSEAITT